MRFGDDGNAPLRENDLQGFWSQFRIAVLTQDERQVESLPRSPLQVKGVTDDDMRMVSLSGCSEVWAAVLKGDTGQAAQPTSELSLIRRTRHWPGNPADAEQCLATICFSRTPIGWRMARVYVSD